MDEVEGAKRVSFIPNVMVAHVHATQMNCPNIMETLHLFHILLKFLLLFECNCINGTEQAFYNR